MTTVFSKLLTSFVLLSFTTISASAQQVVADTVPKGKRQLVNGEMHYNLPNGKTLIYSKPKKWGFITDLPKDAGGIVSRSVKKESVKPWLAIAGSTALLL